MDDTLPKILLTIVHIGFCFQPYCPAENHARPPRPRRRRLSQTETEILSNRLRSNAVNVGIYDVVERQKMQEILDEQEFQLSGCMRFTPKTGEVA